MLSYRMQYCSMFRNSIMCNSGIEWNYAFNDSMKINMNDVMQLNIFSINGNTNNLITRYLFENIGVTI